MELNEIMTNDEVMETATEEIVKASSGCGFKVAAGFGLGILAGMAICKLAKPIWQKIKPRKKMSIIDADVREIKDEVDDDEDESEE